MNSVKTMRDIWDRSKKHRVRKREVIPLKIIEDLLEERFAKTRGYFLQHLERKKMVMDFFPEYSAYLNKAGFTKIK